MESKTRKKGESRMGVHDGHRQRLIARFLEEGLDSFEEHNVLELLLFYSIPRRDTNVLAHRLIDAFGSLAGVLEAPEMVTLVMSRLSVLTQPFRGM